MARLCPEKAPDGLKALLARAGEAPDFARSRGGFAARQGRSCGAFQ